MKPEKFICTLTLLIILCGCRDSPQRAMDKFRGMWKLDKYESFDSAANRWHDSPNRIGYTGYILYDGMGHMGVQLVPPGFKDADNTKNIDSLNIEELKSSLKFHTTSFEYFANCKITEDGNSIEHYKLSSNNPKEWGTTVKRDFEFRGDTLILTSNELIGGLKSRLRWVKL